MEYREESNKMNIDYFSKIIAKQWGGDSDIITAYIFSNISFYIAKNSDLKREIEKIYVKDSFKYFNAVSNSRFLEHIILGQGSLEQEVFARKALGILLEAEYDTILRNKLIKLIRNHNPIIYNAVKKHDKEKLKSKYMKMDIITRNIEAKFDAAIYLYLSVHISANSVDHGLIASILNDIEEFEFGSLMNQNIKNELEIYKVKIEEIKSVIKKEYGNIFNYKDLIRNNKEEIKSVVDFIEDLFETNKININHIFNETISLDKIVLSYVRTIGDKDIDKILPSILSGIFFQTLINEYKRSKKIYIEENREEIQYKLGNIDKALKVIQNENNNLKIKVEALNKEKLYYDKNLKQQLNNLNNDHKQEMKKMEDRIAELEKQLNQEKKLRKEIEELREVELKLEDKEELQLENSLRKYVENKKIIIIGGDKEWRRKFRIKYPQIRTLNGFNENFDINVLSNSDFVFFYTKFMNHSTFYKAMNYLKINKGKFGYIGKTNIELVEQEIVENINC